MAKVSAQILPMEECDLAGLCELVRTADRDEIEAASGLPLAVALSMLLPGSCKASKIVHGGKILALVGDAEHAPGVGVPWLISTVHVQQHPREFLRVCGSLVEDMLDRHGHLRNYVDARNHAAIRWLHWLGFQFGDPVPYGSKGIPFVQFEKTRGL